MWQYCPHCNTYYYKFGRTCPSCWTFSLWEVPVPDAMTQQRLTTLWNDRLVTTNVRGVPAIAAVQLPHRRRYPSTDSLLASPACFPAGTLILADRGLIPIEDIKVGDRVLTHEVGGRGVTCCEDFWWMVGKWLADGVVKVKGGVMQLPSANACSKRCPASSSRSPGGVYSAS
jgi:Hint domain